MEAKGGATGDIGLSAIDAGTGKVALIADDDIIDNNAGAVNVTAAELLMLADADGTGGGKIGDSDVLGTRTPTVNVKAIDTDVDTLTAHSDDGTYVEEADEVTVDEVTVLVDRADFDSDTSPLTKTQEDLTTTTDGPIKLVTAAGTITLNAGATEDTAGSGRS